MLYVEHTILPLLLSLSPSFLSFPFFQKRALMQNSLVPLPPSRPADHSLSLSALSLAPYRLWARAHAPHGGTRRAAARAEQLVSATRGNFRSQSRVSRRSLRLRAPRRVPLPSVLRSTGLMGSRGPDRCGAVWQARGQSEKTTGGTRGWRTAERPALATRTATARS